MPCGPGLWWGGGAGWKTLPAGPTVPCVWHLGMTSWDLEEAENPPPPVSEPQWDSPFPPTGPLLLIKRLIIYCLPF